MTVTGILLTGGKSSRFIKQVGINKSIAEIRGTPLILYVLGRLKINCQQILISVRDEGQITELKKIFFENNIDLNNIKFVIDKKRMGLLENFSDIGPMTGIMSCLKEVQTTKVIISGVDTPLVPAQLDKILLQELDDHKIAFLSGPEGPLFLNIGLNMEKIRFKGLLAHLFMKQNLNMKIRPTDLIIYSFDFVEIIVANGSDLLVNINSKEDFEKAINVEVSEISIGKKKVVNPTMKIPDDLYMKMAALSEYVSGILKEHMKRDMQKMFELPEFKKQFE